MRIVPVYVMWGWLFVWFLFDIASYAFGWSDRHHVELDLRGDIHVLIFVGSLHIFISKKVAAWE